MTKLIVTFCNFDIAPKSETSCAYCLLAVIRSKTAVNVTEYYQRDEIKRTATEGACYAKEGM